VGGGAGRLRGLVRQFLNVQRPVRIYLEDLFVQPAQRGKGIGKALLSQLAKQCVANGWSRLQWSVLDWNTPSIEFYKSLGAVMMDEWTVCRVSGPALTALARGAR
jgi:GNAT superfamily N-acetyltransferase